jgi:phosphoserine phosphatase RsbU/P
MIHEILGLFATTEVFVYVFMEVVTRIESVRRVVSQHARAYDIIFFILMFGGFSIFGTYTGIVLPSGAISSIRDLGPLVAGLVAGPWVGMGAGLIGGFHRFMLGGFTCIPCGVATFLAGLVGGIIFLIVKRKLIGVFYGMLAAAFVELIHGAVTMIILSFSPEAWEAVVAAIPPMIVANGMGVAISIIVSERVLQELKRGE